MFVSQLLCEENHSKLSIQFLRLLKTNLVSIIKLCFQQHGIATDFELMLFGSRQYGLATEKSDFDFVIKIHKEKITDKRVTIILEQLAELMTKHLTQSKGDGAPLQEIYSNCIEELWTIKLKMFGIYIDLTILTGFKQVQKRVRINGFTVSIGRAA